MIALVKRGFFRPILPGSIVALLLFANTIVLPAARAGEAFLTPTTERTSSKANDSEFEGDDSGSLTAAEPGGNRIGNCALKHTDVHASISGYVSRVVVKQTFHNPYKRKIEAVYTFPLPENAAVDDMVMTVGSRTIHGTIYKREQAQQIYETAKQRGYVASLLEQERPNIFTQSVANIDPGKEIEITVRYSELMPYENGRYTFAFPAVVGPRFMPGRPTGKREIGWSRNTDMVPDASRISPPIASRGSRCGHDISLSLDIDAGMPMRHIKSSLHEVKVENIDSQKAHIELVDKNTIPNKDFVLSWQVATGELQSGCLTHRTDKSGYLTLMLVPPARVRTEQVAPKEMIFVIDRSGSQSGDPIKKAKETLRYIVDHMNPQDTFQIISFSNQSETLFDKPEPASPAMRTKAKKYIDALEGDGGTWMGPAVVKACSASNDKHRLRIVTFMTDGYIGNDFEILGLIHKFRGQSRWFAFGTGNSVNRFLIDGIAREGGGEADYILLNSSGEKVAKRFYERIANPVLTDVSLKFEGLDVKDVFPRQASDVWAQRPLYFKARYTQPGSGTVKLTGFAGGKPYEQSLAVTLPESDPENPVLPQIWARAAVDELSSADWFGMQNGNPDPKIKDEIIRLALSHHIMTQFTSFVAVDESVVTSPGAPKQVAVPVEMPDGVSYDKIFGEIDNKVGRSIPDPLAYEVGAACRVLTETPLCIGTFAATANWLISSSRDANLFGGGPAGVSYVTMAPSPVATTAHNGFSEPPKSEPQVISVGVPAGSGTMIQNGSSISLSGASNGTIGPAGSSTIISGVNTAGTVRVNELANLESRINIIANALDLFVFAIGIMLFIRAFLCLKNKKPGAIKAFVTGILWLGLGFLCAPLLLVWIGWKLLWFSQKICFGLARGIFSLVRVKTAG